MAHATLQHGPRSPRLNVLLTEDRPRGGEHWIEQLPRLLEPQGIAAYVARTGEEAIELVGRIPIHAAVIDLTIPMAKSPPPAGRPTPRECGVTLLELIRRLPNPPPVVVVHSPMISRREIDRLLHEALRLGAFSVLAQPVGLEQLLVVFRRLLDQKYHGHWPKPKGSHH